MRAESDSTPLALAHAHTMQSLTLVSRTLGKDLNVTVVVSSHIPRSELVENSLPGQDTAAHVWIYPGEPHPKRHTLHTLKQIGKDHSLGKKAEPRDAARVAGEAVVMAIDYAEKPTAAAQMILMPVCGARAGAKSARAAYKSALTAAIRALDNTHEFRHLKHIVFVDTDCADVDVPEIVRRVRADPSSDAVARLIGDDRIGRPAADTGEPAAEVIVIDDDDDAPSGSKGKERKEPPPGKGKPPRGKGEQPKPAHQPVDKLDASRKKLAATIEELRAERQAEYLRWKAKRDKQRK